MKLPEIKKKTITVKIGEHELLMRYPTVSDQQIATDSSKSNIGKMISILAACLEYDENTIEEKEAFIKSIELKDEDELLNAVELLIPKKKS